MFRVLLRVESVRLRVRENVDLQIIIRKDHYHFTHCRGESLRDGQATLANSSEFLIEAKNPKFDLEVFLVVGETRKRGGTVPVNLRAYAMNASHRVTFPIRKTPLADSTLSVDFVYMLSEGAEGQGPLVSLQRAEELQHRQHLKEITDEHEKLVFHNSRLSEEIRRLKQRNQDLSIQRRSLEQSISRREEEFSSEILQMERERDQTLSNLQTERRQVAEMVEKIAESGDHSLMREMDKVINPVNASDPSTAH